MKRYLIALSHSFAERKAVQDALTENPNVRYWYSCLPMCVFLTSTLSANEIAKYLEQKLRTTQGRFLVVEMTENRQGRLPREAWELFRNPYSFEPR